MDEPYLLTGLTELSNSSVFKDDAFTLEKKIIPTISANDNINNIIDQYDIGSDSDSDSEDEKEKPRAIPSFANLRVLKDKLAKPAIPTILTGEQKIRNNISEVMRDYGVKQTSEVNLDDDRREDYKSQYLEEIDSLRNSLEEDGINLSRVPETNENSSYEQVKSIRDFLRRKNDRNRYCSLTEEGILFGVGLMEDAFDGETTYFGRYTPDLTDWRSSVAVKLRRMRHDTGELVGNMMNDYNISPFWRILLELVPNMFLHNRNQKHNRNSRSNITAMGATRGIRDLNKL